MTIHDLLRRSDPLLLIGALLLGIVSLVLLGTGTETTAGQVFFQRQLLSFGIGCVGVLLVSRLHYTVWRGFAPLLYAAILLLLLSVLFTGAIRGAASWLSFGILRLQPSEIAKIVLVIVLARLFAKRQSTVLDTKTLLLSLAATGLPMTLVALQPDIGTASLLTFVWLGLVAVAGLNRRQLLALCVVGAAAGIVGWSFLLRPYQKERLLVYIRPQTSTTATNYNVVQSVTAFGSGGLMGRGLGYGPQSRLNFLPEHRTDFMFARIGEELGLVGVLGVLALYLLVLWRMWRAALRASDPFGRALAVGAFLTLLVGMFVNAGMNIGLLPVTGVPLPFISYGGSNLVTMFLLVGLVESVIIHSDQWEGDDDGTLLPYA